MRNFGLSLLLIATCISSAPASAQPTGRITGPKPAYVPDDNISKVDIARVTMRSFVRCVIGVSRKRVLDYLDTFPGSPEAYKIANSLSKDDCLAESELRFDEKLFRWAAYGELYSTGYRKFDVSKIAEVPETDYVALVNSLSKDRHQTVAIWQLGECTVRAAPKEANALAKSVIASKAESAAITAIIPHLGGCVNKDNEIKFSKEVLRGMVAEALYKIATKAENAGSTQGDN